MGAVAVDQKNKKKRLKNYFFPPLPRSLLLSLTMEAIPPDYDPVTRERIYFQEWLEYFHYIGWVAASQEFAEEYAAVQEHIAQYGVAPQIEEPANHSEPERHRENRSYRPGRAQNRSNLLIFDEQRQSSSDSDKRGRDHHRPRYKERREDEKRRRSPTRRRYDDESDRRGERRRDRESERTDRSKHRREYDEDEYDRRHHRSSYRDRDDSSSRYDRSRGLHHGEKIRRREEVRYAHDAPGEAWGSSARPEAPTEPIEERVSSIPTMNSPWNSREKDNGEKPSDSSKKKKGNAYKSHYLLREEQEKSASAFSKRRDN